MGGEMMRHLLAATAAVFVVVTACSSTLVWEVMTPWQQLFLTPELEAELAAAVPHTTLWGRQVPILRVAIRLPSQRGKFEWYILPPETVREELQAVYPIPLRAFVGRLLTLAIVQTAVLLAALYATLRAAVRASQLQSGAPIQMPGSQP